MDFFLFLGAQDKEILELVYKANYSVEENTPLCLLGKKFFGFLKREQKTIVICTKNAIDISGYSLPKIPEDEDIDMAGIYIRRALRHEAVHVAQDCNNGEVMNPFSGEAPEIHLYKRDALEASTSISGHRDKEYEAYILEDKPNEVIAALKKYCF